MSGFNTSLRDSQSTSVMPISPQAFDYSAYAEYEARLLAHSKDFIQGDSGLLVYRRVRADGVFYDACQDKALSLELQLGALQKSMGYAADLANFLEPWYGIGYIAGAFGAKYIWHSGQAPAVEPVFTAVEQILNADAKPLHLTDIGRSILEMEEYFLEKTKGKLPISLCDVQSPLNMLSYLMPITELFMTLADEPEAVCAAAQYTADLLSEFLQKQKALLGSCLALPGHGFASSRALQGLGMSDDNAIMISPADYAKWFRPIDEQLGAEFGGTAFHSCGSWKRQIKMVLDTKGLRQADGAFSPQTDPSPNAPGDFVNAFQGSGVILNARAVGKCEEVLPIFKALWAPQQKLIAVTYCEATDEQQRLYNALHGMASM